MQSRMGSPPLAWGIHQSWADAFDNFRITPTCVGNTIVIELSIWDSQDHPHLRGEYRS